MAPAIALKKRISSPSRSEIRSSSPRAQGRIRAGRVHDPPVWLPRRGRDGDGGATVAGGGAAGGDGDGAAGDGGEEGGDVGRGGGEAAERRCG